MKLTLIPSWLIESKPIARWETQQHELICLCLSWYLCESLRYEQLLQLMSERGLVVDPYTIYHFIDQYSFSIYQEKYFNSNSPQYFRYIDQQKFKIKGKIKYLYRAIDQNEKILDFYLSDYEDLKKAKKFLFKSLRQKKILAYHQQKSAFSFPNLLNLLKLILPWLVMSSLISLFWGFKFGRPSPQKQNLPTPETANFPTQPLSSSTDDFPPHGTALASLSTSEKAFLDTIAWAEGTLKKNGYQMLFGGKIIEDLSRHPNQCIPYYHKGHQQCSTAFGRYQILHKNAEKMSFHPESQDRWAIKKLQQTGSLTYLKQGKLEKAFFASCRIWSALPCAKDDEKGYYNQPIKPISALIYKYEERLKLYELSFQPI